MFSKLKKKDGDVFKLAEAGEFDVVVHGCNAQGVMGSGIAKTVRYDYPHAYQAYLKGKMLPGEWTYWAGPKFTIINAITQNHYLPRGVDHFEYDAFASILESFADWSPRLRWGFPYIGMGLAGGDSERIIEILNRFAKVVHGYGGSATLVRFT